VKFDLEELSPAARAALEEADLALLDEWNAPLAPRGDFYGVGSEKLHETERRHRSYEELGHVHAWPPRSRCRRCKKPSGWTHPELGPDHPWLCTEGAIT
jgi:hypothetical protein